MRNRFLAILLVVALLVPTAAALAQDGDSQSPPQASSTTTTPPPAPVKSDDQLFDGLEGRVKIKAQAATNLDQASKFLEYRDEPIGPIADWIEVASKQTANDDWFFSMEVQDAAQKDARYAWEFGRYGQFKVEFQWDRIIHNYAFNGETPYAGIGSNYLTLPDPMQSALEALPGGIVVSTSAPTSTLAQSTAKANLLRSFWNSEDVGDELFLQRDRLHLRTEWTVMDPISFYTEFRYEGRNGQRPEYNRLGLNGSNTSAIELPVPLDAKIWEAEFGVKYAEGPFDATVKYEYSKFDNANKKFMWDSPIRITDSATQGPAVYSKSLEPDNQMHEVALELGYSLDFWRTRISGEAAAAWELMSTDLEAYTTNSTLTMPAALTPTFGSGSLANEANLPNGGNYNAEINIQSYNLLVTSHPVDEADIRATFRHRRQNNDSEKLDFPIELAYGDYGAVTNMISTTGGYFPIPRYEYDQWTAGVDFGYRVSELKSRFFAGYAYNEWDRQNLIVDRTSEHTVKGGVETKWTRDLKTKVTYMQAMRGHSERNSPVMANSAGIGVPQLERYDWSNRIRHRPRFDLNWQIMDGLALSGQYVYTYDDYKPVFGLKELSRHEGEVDIEIEPCAGVMVSPFLGYAAQRLLQVESPGRQSSSTFNYTTSPWAYDEGSDTYTLGLKTRFDVVKDRLQLLLDYRFQKNHTDLDVDSDLGTSSADDANFFVPVDINDSENSTRNSITTRLQWKPSKAATLELGYLYDQYNSDLWLLDGMTPIPFSAQGAAVGIISMNQRFEDAEVHMFWLSGEYKF
ncbi:MAG: MtrB/PioB family outer membrane beta-barrel protein [Planctomycetes bacterium]|nr:MtrB/PioB family outer membrane beta-barrel protein [Planctomycetota bacterium]